MSWQPPVPQSGVTVTEYTIWRGGSPTLPSPKKIGTISASQTSFTDTAPLVGTHYYEVRASDVVNGTPESSGPSNIVKVVF